jgi:hypothetical protein
MERQTKEIRLSGGHVVIFKTYLTGREANEIRSVILGTMKMNIGTDASKVDMSGLSGAFVLEQEHKALGYLLVSLDGDTNAPIDKLLELPSDIYNEVIAEVNKITNPTTPEKSEQLGADISQTAVVEWDIQLIAILCKEMGWTYETYLSQPQEFIFILLEMLKAEAHHANSKV